eukprot:jgi/Undpi1/11765/HiC_scaffold_37.g14060.m1
MRESLVSKKLREGTDADHVRGMVDNVHVLAIGGGSIMDRGRDAILPLVEAIAELGKEHRLVIGVGGGARARHTYAIGMDLGLPIGGLARIVGSVEEQNRNLLQFLLSPHGGITWIKDHFQDLQLFLTGGMIPICIGQPPYHFWEPPSKNGMLPENGPDVGLFLMAEVIGAVNYICVKDVDGVFEGDPNGDGDAGELMTDVRARDLLDEERFPTLPVERELARCLERAKLVRSCRVINGLDADNLRAAIAGENVGTRIHTEEVAS